MGEGVDGRAGRVGVCAGACARDNDMRCNPSPPLLPFIFSHLAHPTPSLLVRTSAGVGPDRVLLLHEA